MHANQPRRSKSMIAVAIGAAVVIVALVAALVLWALGDKGSAPESAPSSPAAPTSEEPAGTEDNGQSGFGTPTADYLGRKVLTPNNPVGEPRGSVRDAPEDVCGPVESGNPAEDVAIEGTRPATLWSVSDGPGAIESGAPTGYSQSPRGAALAVSNYWKVLQRSDDAAKWVLDNRLVVDDAQRKKLEQSAAHGQAAPEDSPLLDQIAPEAYRVTSCSDEYMIIDVARPMAYSDTGEKLDPHEYFAERFGAVWEDGDWKLQVEPMKNSPGMLSELTGDGWQRWAL